MSYKVCINGNILYTSLPLYKTYESRLQYLKLYTLQSVGLYFCTLKNVCPTIKVPTLDPLNQCLSYQLSVPAILNYERSVFCNVQ